MASPAARISFIQSEPSGARLAILRVTSAAVETPPTTSNNSITRLRMGTGRSEVVGGSTKQFLRLALRQDVGEGEAGLARLGREHLAQQPVVQLLLEYQACVVARVQRLGHQVAPI